ncbi:MAG: phosphatidylglycerophosphatase [Blastocatellia bacterium]|jgi:phosphatidylglycerophosphatase A|nr:phosphatidylglycerophosphatase [Blastocatellia bacterium]
MAIKESSDELNSDVVTAAAIPPASKHKTAGDYLALAISTCGVGYFPIAPGTMGSLVGVALYLTIWGVSFRVLGANALVKRLTLLHIFTPQMTLMLVVIFVVTMAGIWAATRAERLFRKEDPAEVVVDEVAGQMIALLSGPFWLHTWWSIFTAFLLFRAFDIWKPYPIRKLEDLETGLGIMADDLAAGAYALIVNSVLISAYLLLFPGAG